MNNEYFYLDDDEEYDKCCGKIFLTTKGRVAIHCTLCETEYEDFSLYSLHLTEFHLEQQHLEDEDEKPVIIECSSDEEDEPGVESMVDLGGAISLENESLREEEVPIAKLQKKLHIYVNKKESKKTAIFRPAVKQTEDSEPTAQEDLSEEFQIPDEVRDVQKRTLRHSTITADQRKYKCPICGLAFKERYNMRHHFKRHTNEKNHNCTKCDKKFHTLSEARIHMRFHTRERPYLCDDCGRAFLTSSHLSSHVKRHRNQRDFVCPTCKKAFYESVQLKNHMKGHSQERPFACKTCGSAFSRRTALSNHLKLHENKRAYRCSLCSAGFNQKAGLYSHMKTTHKATSMPCI